MKWFLTRVVLPGGIVLVAVACAGAMIVLRPSAERHAPPPKVARVEVQRVDARARIAHLEATGTVQAAQEIVLTPEISGKVVWQSDQLVPGGRVAKGDPLVRIDSRDYSLRVEQAEASVKQAELELELEKGRQRVASKEWELLGDGRAPEEAPLALRKPQLATVEQTVSGARATAQQARLNLERTSLRAPFDALVVEEGVDLGQVVSPGTRVARLVGSETMRVLVSVPVERLPAVVLPRDGQPGSAATVVQRLGEEGSVERTGHVVQLLAELDPQTRTARLLVEVEDPLGEDGGIPLLPGAYVDVSIAGRELRDTVAVPRDALYDGDTVWTVEDGHLARHQVDIGWRDTDDVVLLGGLAAGATVVTSPLSLPVDGMPVEVVAEVAAADGSEP
ncbi:MAG: efflux RND transporter periplasmic adaptor subunit [Myxococcales bacterium]|nr:efflux RND transporter periplasmic adaptor subunit [Myxococcales bacterium]